MPRLDSDQEETFCHEYIERFSLPEAVLAAGLSNDNDKRAAEGRGNLLMLRPDIQRRVRELNDAKLRRIDASSDRTMKELASVAFADIRRIFTEDGKLIPVHRLPREVAAAISSIKIERRRVKNGYETDLVTGKRVPVYDDLETVEVKRYDKVAALTIFAKHFKIIGDETDGVNALASALSARLERAKQRVFDNSGAEDARITHPDVPLHADHGGGQQALPQPSDGDRPHA
jgi:phage terminase small subunit